MNSHYRTLRRLVRNLPEFQLFNDEGERESALSNLAKFMPVWGGFVQLVILFVGMFGIEYLIISHFANNSWAIGLFPGIFTMTIIPVYSAFWQRRRAARFFRSRLLKFGIPVCIKCGYCLRGIDSEKCPECGREIEAGIRRMIEIDAERRRTAKSIDN